MLRQTRNHHVQLSTMADAKANMLLTVSSLLITLSAPHILEPVLRLPALLLSVCCLLTIGLAVYTVMPKLPLGTSGKSKPDVQASTFNLLFFGDFAADLRLPTTTLPPRAEVTNFADTQNIDPSKPFVITWDYPTAPPSTDFVQVYIDQGHTEVFTTPELGAPGALDGAARSVTIPPGTLVPSFPYTLNIEIVQVGSINTTTYPAGPGLGGVFVSTALNMEVVYPQPVLSLLPGSNGAASIQVVAFPNSLVILQQSDNFGSWLDVSTNSAPDGTNLFPIVTISPSSRFFRARQ